MVEKVTVIKGPMVPGQTSRLWESNVFHPVYMVYLDTGVIVTNPSQFPEEAWKSPEPIAEQKDD